MESRHAFEEALAVAKRDLAAIQEEIEVLMRRRKALEGLIASTEGVLGSSAGGAPPARAPRAISAKGIQRALDPASPADADAAPIVVDRALAATVSSEEAALLRSRRRHYLGDVTADAARIVREAGRPMNAAEIHERHPERERITSRLLYRTLMKRVAQNVLFRVRDGRFWFLGEAYPEE